MTSTILSANTTPPTAMLCTNKYFLGKPVLKFAQKYPKVQNDRTTSANKNKKEDQKSSLGAQSCPTTKNYEIMKNKTVVLPSSKPISSTYINSAQNNNNKSTKINNNSSGCGAGLHKSTRKLNVISFKAALTSFFLILGVLTHSGECGNPDAKRLYDDLLSTYNKLVRPVVNVTDILTVRIKLRLSQLIDVVRKFLIIKLILLLSNFL